MLTINSTISVLPKHRRNTMANLLRGYCINVVGLAGVEQIRQDLISLGEDPVDVYDTEWLFVEEIGEGMFEVQI